MPILAHFQAHPLRERNVRATTSTSDRRAAALTLRRTLLLAFVLLGLLPTAALAVLGFAQTRDAMTAQIQQSLTVQARSIQSDIDQLLFERFENAMVWRRSELMDDLRFGDVDKRVANYLVGLQRGYGDVYLALDCVGPRGDILASSLPARPGARAPAIAPHSVSVDARLPDGAATLALPDAHTLGEGLPLAVSVAIPSAFPPAAAGPDQLRLLVNPATIEHLLDVAAQGHRVIVVVDGRGRWIAGSRRLRGLPLPAAAGQAQTLAATAAAPQRVVARSPWLATAALVGHARSTGVAGFPGSGWTTLVFEPVDDALAPVSRVAAAFWILFAIVVAATLSVAAWIASSIARPIARLTERTAQYRDNEALPPSPSEPSRITELQTLETAYDALMRSLAQSRLDLVRSSKMALLGELGAVLAHEVRTPLGILRSSAQVLKRNAAIGPQGVELVSFIESETERLNRLVSTLLDTARAPQPVFAPCDLHALLRQCVQMHELRQPSATAITLELEAADPAVDADAEQLKQVFFNLLANAAEAAGATGSVAIGTLESDGELLVRCEDSGPGVPPELESRIFEPFVTRRAGGFGLGLAVVRQIIAAHHGAIHVGRSRWQGALFTVSLPRRPASLESPP